MDSGPIEEIISKNAADRANLISILEAIQDKYSYLPEEALRRVSRETEIPMVDVYGVATFYRSFSLKPRGKHLVSVCLGTACHVRSAPKIAKEFERQLQVRPGETTRDREFTFETVNCLGACALGPIVVVDGHYFSNVKTMEIKDILRAARRGLDKVEIEGDPRIFPLNVACPRCNRSLLDSKNLIDGYPSIRVVASFHRKHGSLRMSCLYGSFVVESDHEIPERTIINLFCPHCHGELNSATNCAVCEAPMVPMMVRGGGTVHICSRKGCREHRLDLNGVNV